MADPRDRSSMGAVLLIARLGFTGRVGFTVWRARPTRAQQVDGSAGKHGSSSRLGEGWQVVSAGDESAGGHDSAANDEPEIVDDPAGVADLAHDDDDPAGVCWPSTWCWRPGNAPEEVLQLPAKRLGDGSSKSERAMTTQEVHGFQRVCGGMAQLRRVRTPQIK